MKTVAVLFAEPDGVYANVPEVDLWPESRDAKTYAGNLPVVAHPPCHLWINLACANYARWGGEHNRPGNDDGCFEAALAAVDRCGGVLEHPKNSRAFKHFGLPHPNGVGWLELSEGGKWVCEVWQSAYGHRANKATWLYYCGVNPPLEMLWDKVVGAYQVGFQDKRGKAKNKPTLSKKEANATPVLFKNVLIDLAKNANGAER